MKTQPKTPPKGPTQNPDNGVVRYNEKLGRFETYSASWDDLSSLVGSLGPIVGFQAYQNSTRQVLTDNNSFTLWKETYQKKQANTKLVIYANLCFWGHGSSTSHTNMGIGIGGVADLNGFQTCLPLSAVGDFKLATGVGIFAGLSTGDQVIHFGWSFPQSYARRPANVFNQDHRESYLHKQYISSAIVVEVAF